MFRITTLTAAFPRYTRTLLITRSASVLTALPQATTQTDITSPPPPPTTSSVLGATAIHSPTPTFAGTANRARVTLTELRQMLDTARGLVQQLERRHAEGESARLRREMEVFMEEQREAIARIEVAIARGSKKGNKAGEQE